MNETNKSKGCTLATILIILAILVVLAILIGVFSLFAVRSGKAKHAQERAAQEFRLLSSGHFIHPDPATDHSVTLTAESFRRHSTSEVGDELTREQFAARMADSNSTSLSRQDFMRKVNGRTVRWLLRTCEVDAADDSGPLRASFDLPYRIETSSSSWSGSSIQFSANFSVSELERLAKLRRNDWVTIEGRLEIRESGPTRLVEAKIIAETD